MNVSVTTNTTRRRRRQRSKNQKKNKQVQRRAARNRNKQTVAYQQQLGRRVFMLSPCAKQYLAVLTDPFNPRIESPCIPDLYDFPSKKGKYINRGVMGLGTQGFGFIIVTPWPSVTNNVNFVTYSTQAYTDTKVVAGYGATTPADCGCLTNQQCPYSAAALIANANYARIVGCGVRARYIGTELQKGGNVVVYRFSGGIAVDDINVGSYTMTNILGDQRTRTYQVGRSWKTIAFSPKTSSDYDFVNLASIATTGNNVRPDMLIMASGTPGNLYEFEVISFIEYTGQGLNDVTKSNCDLPGLSAVRDVTGDSATIPEAGPGLFQQSLEWIKSAAASETSGTVAVGAATKIVDRMISRL